MRDELKLWIDRTFDFGHPPELAPNFIERLCGAPLLLREKLSTTDRDLTARPAPDKWSIQEHAGHLWDVEELWLIRFEEFKRGVKTLTAAEMSGRKTFEADHNPKSPEKILTGFRDARSRIVSFLEGADIEYFKRTALHPRLKKTISPVDLMYFISEHDNHHLTVISRLLRQQV